MFPRLLTIDPNSRKSFFLFGPRGTGKTSWVRTQFKNHIYLDLLDADVFITLQSNPKNIARFVPEDYSGWIILDEVQKLPHLLDEVHRLIENKKYKFILTGSSARSLRRQGVNLLAGRALRYHLYPLTAKELGNVFNLKKSLRYGQLPLAITDDDPVAFLQAYVQAYLREEVLQEGLTRNLSAFTRFLETAAFSQGSFINASNIAREIGVDQKTIVNYLTILEDLLLAYRLPIFTKHAQRQLIAQDKFYYFDVGVYQTIRPVGLIDSENEVTGVALESLFIQEIRALNDYLKYNYQLYFWRTRAGLEVDLIAHNAKQLLAFEIKSTRNINKQDLKGLKAFKKDYPTARCYLFYLGTEKRYFDDIEAWPIEIALRHPEQWLGEIIESKT